ncbi:hypothetical protein ATANTOWER_025628 [Ataeniobius toweri]|uniref:Uncharacterized protein n=1 Tax=Ataeniobius toweri TaxID=208326 RepID=A0ABU7A8V6_9TELE|nr:hypothetical protein [Ataeniobius toweri]
MNQFWLTHPAAVKLHYSAKKPPLQCSCDSPWPVFITFLSHMFFILWFTAPTCSYTVTKEVNHQVVIKIFKWFSRTSLKITWRKKQGLFLYCFFFTYFYSLFYVFGCFLKPLLFSFLLHY